MMSQQTLTKFLQRRFKLDCFGVTIRTEMVAGLTTFLTMAYIIFVNPAILSQSGMPASAVFTATCFVAVIGSLLMGWLANYPIAVAPSMGMNAYFTYAVVLNMHYSWQTALGAVFISGVVFFLLTVLKVRQLIIEAIPSCIAIATAAGIGLFIGVIALKNAGIVVGNPNTLVALGNIATVPVLLSLLGFFMIAALDYHKVPGAILISVLVISLIALLLGKTQFYGVFSLPPSISSTALALSTHGLLSQSGIGVIFSFVLIAFFDSSGTLLGVLQQTNPPQKHPKIMARALMSDSIATIAGGLMGTSNTSSYIESAAGVRAGGRTGLTAITVAALFILALFFSPLAKMIPIFASTPALLFIACMMLGSMKKIEWDDLTQAIPAAITMIMIPFSFSIADGIGLGFISYTAIKLLSGKFRQINLILIGITALFILYFL